MTWFFYTILAVALWASSSYIDKYLISRYFNRGQIGSMAIFTSILSLLIPLSIFLFSPALITTVSIEHILVLIVGGLLLSFYLIPYFYALKEEDTSLVTPLFQTVSVFTYVLGFLFLGESLTSAQIIAGLFVIGGAVLLSVDFTKRVRIKGKFLCLMLLSSFIYALSILLFKWAAIDESFWASSFWESLGVSLFGIILFMIPSYRRQFLETFRGGSKKFLPMMAVNEFINIGAKLLVNFATLLAPIVLVTIVGGVQPMFSFAYGIILTWLLPSIIRENVTKKIILQKILAIIVIFCGTAFLIQ